MSLDEAEFLRLLPIALQNFNHSLTNDRIAIAGPDLAATIHFDSLPKLRIASLCLPRLRVTFEVSAPSANAAHLFIAGFLSHYQRGGG